MTKFRSLLTVLALLLVATASFAQTTSSLIGTATTEGAPLPGVTVTISSPALQGTRTTVTGNNGGYIFPALNPGTYTVRFDLEGLQSVTKTVNLALAAQGRSDADLRVSAIAEAITVTASAPSVLETPQVATNIEAELQEELPIGRTVLAAALLAPGVNGNTVAAGQLSISGSPGYDNLVLVNGVAITESVRSQALNLFIEDAIQETTILTGSVSAEYGRFTGGVVNSITKSGGNSFTGSLRDSLSNPSWTDKTPFATQPDPLDKLNEVYEGTLGGYILRDRLWFFTSGRQAETSDDLQTRPLPGSTQTFTFVQTIDEQRLELKLTGQITDKHNIVASYLDRDQASTNTRFTAVSYDLDSLTDREDPQNLKSAHYNGVITPNFLVEAQYSALDFSIGVGSGAKFTDPVRGTIVRNRADGNARFNSPTFCGVCDTESRNNDGFLVKGNYFLSSRSLGNHNIVAGYESFSEHRYANNFQSGSNFRFFVNSVQRVGDKLYPTVTPGPGGAAAYFAWTPIFTGANENDLQTDSIFVNDRWELNEYFSFGLGARYDANNAVDGNGRTVSDDSAISPRVSAAYDIFGNGKHRVTASYADYVSRIVEGPGTSASSAGSPAYIEFAYQGPAINPVGTPTSQLLDTRQALAIVFDWFNAQGGTNNLANLRASGARSVPGFDSIIDSNLSSPKVSEIVLGYGVQVGTNAYAKIDLIDRTWSDFYAFRVDQTTPELLDPLGINHDVQIVENTDLITRDYQAVQFQSQYRPGRFNFGLNYTWSELTGNDEQESATSGTVGNAPGSLFYSEYLNYARRQPEGRLSQDQTHRARTWVGFDVPIPSFLGGLNLSLLHNFDSGQSYSAVGAARLGTAAGLPSGATLGYVSPPSSGQYYFSDRGEFELEDIHRTDLAVNYNFPRIWKLQLYAQADVLNLFENDEVTGVSTTVTTANNSTNFTAFNPFTTPVESLIECPQGTPGATCRTMGAHWQKGASFGLPTGAASYQLPFTYQASVGVRF